MLQNVASLLGATQAITTAVNKFRQRFPVPAAA